MFCIANPVEFPYNSRRVPVEFPQSSRRVSKTRMAHYRDVSRKNQTLQVKKSSHS